MEIDPQHPVIEMAPDHHWQAICALLIRKLGTSQAEISLEEINQLAKGPAIAVVIRDTGTSLKLDIVERRIVLTEAGGLPS
jgi:hypothetical protein